MAFDLKNFDTVSYAGNSNAPRVFCYKTTDTLAEVAAAGYFDQKRVFMRIGDLIYVYTSDGAGTLVVDAVETTSPYIAVKGFGDFTTSVTITSAEILALRATPKTLVSAPGAGLLLEFVSMQLILDYNSAAYTESTDNLAVKFVNGSGAQVSQAIEATGFIDQTADTVTNALPKIDAIVAASGAVNKALVLHNTGDGEYAAGNSPIRAKVVFRLHKTGL